MNLGDLLRFGQEAVILFFMLSGFVIHYSTVHSKDASFSNFFIKRFTRIYIPLVAVFFIGFLTESYNNGGWVIPELKQVIFNLFMLQDWAFAKPNVIAAPLLNNNPLWSLSYEWWFYMMYFPIATYLASFNKSTQIVLWMSLLAALTYVVYPFFLNRVVMYFAIWWTGASLADAYLNKKPMTVTTLAPCLLTLLVISAVLLFNLLLARQNGSQILFGTHPFLELRHFVFALLAVGVAIVWHANQWVAFNTLFRPFAVLAPISYAIYISHYHIMTSANYLSFINQPIVEWFCYFAVMLGFCWLLEVKFYRWVCQLFKHHRRSHPITARA